MSTYYLVNSVRVGTRVYWPGSYLNSAVDDTAGVIAAGGRLIDSSNAVVAAAATIAQEIQKKGGSIAEAESAMLSAASAAFDTVDAVGVMNLVSFAGAAIPAAGTTMHAQDAGGGALALVSGFTNPLPRRNLGITRSNAGPSSVDYTVTYTLPDGTTATETIAAAKNATTYGTIAAVVTGVSTTVDPVSTTDFVTGTGFSIGQAFAASPAPVLSVSGVVEAAASSHAASGTIVPTTAPNGTRAFSVLAKTLSHSHTLS